ncbi:MAG: hypothetical protein ABR986_10715 [Methanomassiliicoccales archaeon]|jgi:hypothetical protein
MTLMGDMKRRPLRITIIGVVSIFAGLIFLFPVLGSFGLANLVDLSGQTFKQGPLVLTTTVIAIANFILGFGCLYGWRPIWLYLTVLSLLNFVVAVVVLYNADMSHWGTVVIPLLWLIFAIYVLISMQSRKTKAWFGR